jgi:hypothetical protein
MKATLSKIRRVIDGAKRAKDARSRLALTAVARSLAEELRAGLDRASELLDAMEGELARCGFPPLPPMIGGAKIEPA